MFQVFRAKPSITAALLIFTKWLGGASRGMGALPLMHCAVSGKRSPTRRTPVPQVGALFCPGEVSVPGPGSVCDTLPVVCRLAARGSCTALLRSSPQPPAHQAQLC
mmetsp:Transcript_37671/g.62365  ORF Transcript_37671/g.62365 Transcript_37671/m.62365 type:complete len:106 (-) Transcript_37671:41-358(-)